MAPKYSGEGFPLAQQLKKKKKDMEPIFMFFVGLWPCWSQNLREKVGEGISFIRLTALGEELFRYAPCRSEACVSAAEVGPIKYYLRTLVTHQYDNRLGNTSFCISSNTAALNPTSNELFK